TAPPPPHTVLTMEGGIFKLASSGQVAENPDWSMKTDKQVLNSAPNHAKLRTEELGDEGMSSEKAVEITAQEMRSNPRLIFVMDESGTFYATEGELHDMHHSTFFAGKGIASAGEIGLSGGVPTYLSNSSGHYMPGPLHVWQAVHALASASADVSKLEVVMFGVSESLQGDVFLKQFLPGVNLSGDAKKAVAQIEDFLAGNGSEAPGRVVLGNVVSEPRNRA
ncbi:MAG: hypothetical protein ACI9MC_004098, partial [Kiritimatiellia bacterium]